MIGTIFPLRAKPHQFALRNAVVALVAIVPVSVRADVHADAALARRLDSLEKTVQVQSRQIAKQAELISVQQERIDVLTNSQGGIAALPDRIARVETEVLDARTAQIDRAKVQMTQARATVSSADNRFTFSPRAVVQLDAASYNQSDRPLAKDYRRGSIGSAGNRETSAAGDLSNGAYFRRARFGFEGTFDRDFNYRIMLELGGGGTEGPTRINDAWLNYSALAPFTVQVGAFSAPASLSDGTSPEDSLFSERPTVAEVSRTFAGADGRIGFGARYDATRGMWAITATTRTVNDPEVFDSQFAVVGRTSWLVASSDAFDNGYNVHVGASGSYIIEAPDAGRTAGAARYALRLRDRPEIRVDSTRLIDTGPIDAAHASVVGVELASNWRNFFLQGEHFWFDFAGNAPVTSKDLSFKGWYVEGSWVMTGESRRYNVRSGSFQNPRPAISFSPTQAGWGAWELAARFSHMDLDDHAGRPGEPLQAGGVRGGTQSIRSVGLNGYLTPNVKVMLNFLDISVRRLNPAGPGALTPFGTGAATPPPGVDIGQNLKVWTMRTQYSF